MNKIIQFLREAYAELIRVTWPTRSQTVQYTILVVIISLGVAAFLGALDYMFGIGVKDYLIGTPDAISPPGLDVNNAVQLDSGTVAPVDGEISGEVQVDASPEIEVTTEGDAPDVAPQIQDQLEQALEVPENADL